MDIDFIDRLIGLVERSSLVDLEYSENGTRVRLTKGAPEAASLPPVVREATALVPVAAPVAPPTAPAAAALPHTQRAGIVGTFYRASAPGQPPFVQVGDIVAEGQPLGLIDAMKMLNQVEAERAGRIVAILVEDGGAVDGQSPLFQIAPVEATDV
ncbi:acetyl-CoA carboxylase biotin carboxyl carrier protein [Variovorax sp. CY25R-8]|uniref:acetyl-CoA carboxylase biotin carboxyl carrier protein n=1 Tax=Variovorax sp. CY25R-8 TaxID=2855501 RepID=UPI0021BAF04C|nr:acetyl-CoA carboxylase biotin carboxyl carrier protein [Variovorax sp. CY25R-8]MCT8179214.1 acetyl-CoA carboxylase biotin carboxyl carrier protein [Variovorax sp. CY25R-8]